MKKNGVFKYVLLLIVLIVVFSLLVLALITENRNGAFLFIQFGETDIKYVVAMVMLIMPFFLLLTFRLTNKYKEIERHQNILKSHRFSKEFLDDSVPEIEIKDEFEITKEKTLEEMGEIRKKVKLTEVPSSFIEAVTLDDDDYIDVSNDEPMLLNRPESDGNLQVSHSDTTRFFMLNEIDKKMKNYKAPEYDNDVTLEEICVRFRNYASGEKKLYYDIKDIRRFIAGLSVTKLLILQGMSGTGKTSLAFAFGEFLQNQTVVVPIQPMWKERTDLIGYYNEFTKKFNETTLLNKMYEANTNKNIYITVLDEMNIARVEYYFAEFLSLLELPKPEARNLDVVSDVWDTDPVLLHEGKLRLPINMWFIGTANNDDSTFAISDKVYDRAMVLNLDTKAEEFDSKEHRTLSLSIDHLYDLFDKAQKEFEISERNLRRIRKLDKFLINTFKITFGNRIMKQIRAYVPVVVACGGTELEAIDDILSRKVLRKLESKNPVYVRSQSENLIKQINDLFGQDVMKLCIDVIQSIEQNM